jgi:hypothetical protein
MAVSAEMVFGMSQEGDGGKAVTVQFCDFASAGGTWDLASYYRVWIRQVLNTVLRRTGCLSGGSKLTGSGLKNQLTFRGEDCRICVCETEK